MKKIIIVLFLIGNVIYSQAQDTKTILNKAISVLSSTNSYQYSFSSEERINGEMVKSLMDVKLMQSPHKIYVKNTAGKNEGKELLYVKGENKNKVLINVAWGFSLNPFSSLIRKGNHYTILDSGFKNVKAILKSAKDKAEAAGKFNEVFVNKGIIDYNGRKCYKLEITDPTFKYVSYTIKNGESLYQLAKRLNICEQLIIEKNSNLSGFDSAKDGMVIQIPSSYAKSSTVYIDTQNYHTIYQELRDDKGVFERYGFKNLKINPSFSADEFTEDYDGYNF